MTDVLAAVHRWMAQHQDPTPDADLLARFTASRDAEAFKRLVGRHGGLVWAVCRRMLPAEPEDAFQATFLALVRSASRIRAEGPLGGWLHRAAVRVCLQARRTAARRAARERAAARPEPVGTDPDWNTVQAVVHEEIERLPGSLRAAFVLCELQGVRPIDAAAQLGWKAGTLTGRLCKARQMLQSRLVARGVVPTAALATVSVEASGCPAELALAVLGTGSSAGPGVSHVVLELARGATEGTMMTTSKLMVGVALVVGLLAVNGGQWSPTVIGQQLAPPAKSADVAPRGAAPAAANPVARKWEYKFVAQPRADVLTSVVAQFGEEGWELTTVLALTRNEVLAAFKADPKRVLDADGATALLVFKRPTDAEFPPPRGNWTRPAENTPRPATPGIGSRP